MGWGPRARCMTVQMQTCGAWSAAQAMGVGCNDARRDTARLCQRAKQNAYRKTSRPTGGRGLSYVAGGNSVPSAPCEKSATRKP
eukprot:scaffold479_cov119-Isochrysis_galbana.AAC.4